MLATDASLPNPGVRIATTVASFVNRFVRRGRGRSPVPCAHTLLLLDIPPVPASVHFRVYDESIRGVSVLAWATARLARALGGHPTIGLFVPELDLERVRASLGNAPAVRVESLTPHGQIGDVYALMKRTLAEQVLVLDLTAALLPAEVWHALWDQHIKRGNQATILDGTPCATRPLLIEAPLLALLARRENAIALNIRSAVQDWARGVNGGSGRLSSTVHTVRAMDPELATASSWPYRVSLELPCHVDLLRQVVQLTENKGATGSKPGEPLDYWVAAETSLTREIVRDVRPSFSPNRADRTRSTILYAQSPSAFSGTEQVVAQLTTELLARPGDRYRCTALVALPGTFTARLARAGVDVHGAGRNFAMPTIENFGYCRSALDAFEPNLVHSHTVIGLPFCCALAEFEVPLVQHVHVSHERALLALEDQLHLASHIIAVSEFVKRRVLRFGIEPDRVRVIHNGVKPGPPPGQRRDEARRRLRRDLQLPDHARLILMPARIVTNKRQDVALEAFAAIGPRASETHLLFIGDMDRPQDRLTDTLKSRAQRLSLAERVHFLGFREDMARLYAAADALLLPSEDEPFGLVILEAMAAGVPVVASRSGGIPEIIEHERSGLLVEPGDVSGFADALRQVLTERELRDRLLAEGRTLCETHFSLTRFVDEVLEVYEEALGFELARSADGSVAGTGAPAAASTADRLR